jgi:hypothetical protein
MTTMDSTPTTKQIVIQTGLDFLEETGSSLLCKLCISKGGSCCGGCKQLKEGIGCQLRNTSCTAWLCGFLKYILYEAGLLEEWNSFWKQVPGQKYRTDKTPSFFVIRKQLKTGNLRFLSEALVEDLKDIAAQHTDKKHIIYLREEIDNNLDRLKTWRHHPGIIEQIVSHLQTLTKDFHRFHQAIEQHRQTYCPKV